jgi:hypothetical protein
MTFLLSVIVSFSINTTAGVRVDLFYVIARPDTSLFRQFDGDLQGGL